MLRTRLCEVLKIDHPIINAPMAGTAGAELAAAVSEAGGFGMIGGSTGGPDWLRAQIHAVRERTARPFGVGFISSAPDVDVLLRVALEERVAAIGHSFADPTPYMSAARAAGVAVLAQVQTVAGAQAAVRAGVDLIAAQGTEAGGHTGHAATLALIPAVVDRAGTIPVVAAGGIADGRGLAAVLMLGAEGAWIGTRFLASREALAAEWVQQRVVEATADDTLLTKVYDLTADAPFPREVSHRVLRNEFTATWHGRDDEVVERRVELQAELARAWQTADARRAAISAGNAVSLIHGVEPAGEIVRHIVAEAEALLRTRPVALLR